MNKKQIMMWALCLSLFLIPLQAASAAAAVPGDGRKTYETTFTGSDSSLTGTSSQQQYFTVMDYWNVQDLQVNLHFQISQITEDQISSVTLSLNGSPFYSFRPSLQNNGEQSVTIPAPKGFLKQGVNTLSIQGYLRTAGENNQVCYVDNTPDNW
ncbi:cellulose biosynthesis cyclic di-GMP-binding regulatory protein BcsB, partial [Paenibacillus graminis]